ncbi:MAG: hypothetical protein GC152_13225 [Alphaproteobacteria bacterium]|nr:hypothetical protein [Alphaproteobacteria bacterium]
MDGSLKALVVVIVVVAGVFFAGRSAMTELVPGRRFDRWAIMAVLLVPINFLVANFWLATAAAVAVALGVGYGERRKAILFIILAFMMADGALTIPGLAGMNKLADMSALIAAIYLFVLPATFERRDRMVGAPFRAADLMLLGFFLLTSALAFRETTFTNGLRVIIQSTAILAPIYIAFSRIAKSTDELLAATCAVASVMIALGAVAIFEYALQWHFYSIPRGRWGIGTEFDFGIRAGSLRSFATTGTPIAFGVMLAAALPLTLGLRKLVRRKSIMNLGVAALAIGLLATLSRTSWIAGVIGVAAYYAVGPKAFGRLVQFGFVGALGGLVLLATPYGDSLWEILPWIGGGSTDTFDYRTRLFEISTGVIAQNPWFGIADPASHPDMQVLVQGQGIVDLVNSYLAIALNYGLVGLGLFAVGNIMVVNSAMRAAKAVRSTNPTVSAICQAFVGAHVALLFGIAGTSWSVGMLGEFTWLTIGLTAASARLAFAVAEKEAEVEATPADDAPSSTDAADVRPTASDTPGRPVPKHLRQYVS